jgi:hypothetical protein
MIHDQKPAAHYDGLFIEKQVLRQNQYLLRGFDIPTFTIIFVI